MVNVSLKFLTVSRHEEGDCHVCANNTKNNPKCKHRQQSWCSSAIFWNSKTQGITHGEAGEGQNQKQSNTGKQIWRGRGNKCLRSQKNLSLSLRLIEKKKSVISFWFL